MTPNVTADFAVPIDRRLDIGSHGIGILRMAS
jgi:hypothetical protein